MHIVIKGAKITDTLSSHHQSIKDIRILNGIISEISNHISETGDAVIYHYEGKNISTGWIDTLAHFQDPGNEQKEDLHSGIEAAMKGGFTSVCLMPSTHPALHSKAEIEYIKNKTAGTLVNVYPYGAITKGCSGKELTEMYDMFSAGAIAFTDAEHAIKDDGIMLRALQYMKTIHAPIINIPNDYGIVGNATLNEGVMSMQLGMYGIPNVLEELMVIRDMKLAEYADAKIHVACISAKESVEAIRIAKRNNIQVSASVSAMHLYFDESVLFDYNTFYKINPPLRTQDDINALRNGILDGTINTICSNHLPHESDAKFVEFEYAAFGAAGIECAFSAAWYALNKYLPIEKCIDALTHQPKKNLNLPCNKIEVGEKADLTIFDAEIEWTLTKDFLKSKSVNNPFIGKPLKGKALAIINNNQINIL